MPRANRTEVLKIRVTPEEHEALIAFAQTECSLSALVRKRVFGQDDEAVRYLARIHGSVLEIARTVGSDKESLPATLVLSHLVAIERHLNELLRKQGK